VISTTTSPRTIYWKEEAEQRRWKSILATPEAIKKAIASGAMYTTWVEFSEPVSKNCPSPHRWGLLPVDIDNADFATARADALAVVEALLAHGVKASDFRIFYSGSKGFHIEVPAAVFGAEDGHQLLPFAYKRLLRNLLEKSGNAVASIDWSVYAMRRGKMWRIVNVKRRNGRHKIPLRLHELRELPEADVIKLSESPRTLPENGKKPSRSEALASMYQDALAEVVAEQERRAAHRGSSKSPDLSGELEPVPHCIRGVIETPYEERGMFNRLSMLLISFFVAGGYDEADALEAAGDWVANYGASETYSTAESRFEHWATLWSYMADNPDYGFGCQFAKGQGVPGSVYDCSGCHRALPVFEEIDVPALESRCRELLKPRTTPPFDTCKLPAVMAEFVNGVTQVTEAAPITITMALLGECSALLKHRVCLPRGQYFSRLYPNIWALSVSPSGFFKSTAMNYGTGPASEKASQIADRIRQANLRLLFTDDLPKDEVKQLKAEVKREVADLEYGNPLLPQKVTTEALLEVLASGGGGLLVAQEFAEFLEALQVTHNVGQKALFTNLYDVPEHYRYRTKNSGDYLLHHPFISIVGVSTLDWLRSNVTLSDVGSGFFARFLLFAPEQKRTVPPALPRIMDAMPHEKPQAEILQALEAVADGTDYRLAPRARDLFEHVHRGLYSAMDKQPERTQELLSPYLKRWSPYVLKMAMIFQAVNDPHSREINESAIQSGHAVVEQAIQSTVMLFETELGLDAFTADASRVLEYIAKRDGTVAHATLVSSRLLPGGTKAYEEIITYLFDSGQLVLSKNSSVKAERTYSLSTENPTATRA